MSSSAANAEHGVASSPGQGAQSQPTATTEPLPDDYEVEADDEKDSASGTESPSDTTSISSSIYAGFIENGRRYQTTREGDYFVPSDEKQFESLNSVHLMLLVLDSGTENPYFRSPLSSKAQNILDIGTGNGMWAINCADKFPGITVTGVDLYPPPHTWMPPNCILEVDDLLQTWSYPQHFDMIHIRLMYGSFTDAQWKDIYKQAYDNLAPGGWIEQVEPNVCFLCDDGTMPADSVMANWGKWCIDTCHNAGRTLDVCDRMKDDIEANGFINVHEKVYKIPVGGWTKHKSLKEAGRLNKKHFEDGMEGYTMYLQTRFGLPKPWSPDEVQAHLAKARKELNQGWHMYNTIRRVWAQKPMDAKPAVKEPEAAVETLA